MDLKIAHDSLPSCRDSEKPNWSELPTLALENIFLSLNRIDRCRMSEVCKNWFTVYMNSPSLWRTITFINPDRGHYNDVWPDVQCARKYGHMSHHVEIICNTNLYSESEEQLKLFLKALTDNSQLLSIDFINIHMCRNKVNDRNRKDIYQTILNLISSQHKLQSVQILWGKIKKVETAELCRMISVNNFSTLKSLKLEECILESTDDDPTSNLIDPIFTYLLFMNLRELFIDYSQLFESMIMSCFEYAVSPDVRHRKGTLEIINLKSKSKRTVRYNGIPPAAWECLKKVWPALKIDLSFSQVSTDTIPLVNENTIKKFVVSHMPVRFFNFKDSALPIQPIENVIGPVLRYLVSCKINLYLEKLTMSFMLSRTNLITELIHFVPACPRLQELNLDLIHPVEALESIFNFWFVNGAMCLEFVNITIYSVPSGEESTNYLNIADHYAAVLKVHSLHLTLEIGGSRGFVQF